jgi:hypothetical protein
VPGLDHVNDVIQTFVRPTAGAILFAANAGVIRDASPALALITGLVLAFSVHATKAVARPVVNTTTVGLGAPVISVVEDLTSVVASLLAVFAPVLFVVFAVIVIILFIRLYQSLRNKRRAATMAVDSDE